MQILFKTLTGFLECTWPFCQHANLCKDIDRQEAFCALGVALAWRALHLWCRAYAAACRSLFETLTGLFLWRHAYLCADIDGPIIQTLHFGVAPSRQQVDPPDIFGH